MRNIKKIISTLSLCTFLLAASPGFAQAQTDTEKHAKAVLVYDKLGVQPGGSQPAGRIGVLFRIEPGWHIYWRNPGDAGIPTSISWELPDGFSTGPLIWPAPEKFAELGGLSTNGYDDETLLFAQLYSPARAGGRKPVVLKATAKWLACKDVCIKEESALSLTLPWSLEPAPASPEYRVFEAYSDLVPQDAPPSPIKVTPLLLAVAPQVKFGLLFEGLPVNRGQPEENLQVFPYEAGEGVFSPFTLIQVDLRAAPVSPGSVMAVSEVETQAEKIEGIVVFSRSMLQRSSDAVFEWRIPLNAPLQPYAERLLSESGPGSLLTFRTEQAAAEEQPLSSEPGLLALLLALLSGFAGGLLLNFMPCVLPIIALKVSGVAATSRKAKSELLVAAGGFVGGVLCSFLVLALIVIILRAGGQTLGWGFQFQHPAFVLAVSLILFVLALGFFDAYTIFIPGLQKLNRAADMLPEGTARNFLDGVLATVLSTPCSAPFLGTALVYAFTAPASAAIAVFLAVGLGLSLPYFCVTAYPPLARALPEPGAWMIRLKELMGFLLLGTVIWLLFILDQLTEAGGVWAVVLMLAIYFLLWLARWIQSTRRPVFKTILAIAWCVCFAALVVKVLPRATVPRAAAALRQTGADSIWHPYSAEDIQRARRSGRPVFIQFTADWCLTCKANELLTLNSARFAGLIAESGAYAVRADWTNGDPEITQALESYGAKAVPLYVVLPADPTQQPILLNTIPTTSSIKSAFDKARS